MSGFDSAIPNHGPVVNITQELVSNSTMIPIQGYNFYTTSLQSLGLQLTVDLHVVIGDATYSVDFQQTYFLGTGTPYTPPTVSNTTTVARLPGQSSSSSVQTYPSLFAILYALVFVFFGITIST